LRIFLQRDVDDGICTLGRFCINNSFFCYTLELPIGSGMRGQAIPAGTYDLGIYFSEDFKRLMPYLLNVPGRSGIMIHPGNWVANTKGCILVGEIQSKDAILESRDAFDKFFPQLQDELDKGNPSTITVINPLPTLETV